MAMRISVTVEPGGEIVIRVAADSEPTMEEAAHPSRADTGHRREAYLAVIRALLAEGLSANEICRRIGGNRNRLLAEIRQIRGGGQGRRYRAPRGRAPAMRGRRERLARRATIRALLAEGLSANEICRRIGGDRTRLLAEIRQIRGGGIRSD